jgi:uncharacterized protein (TIGR03435 family)
LKTSCFSLLISFYSGEFSAAACGRIDLRLWPGGISGQEPSGPEPTVPNLFSFLHLASWPDWWHQFIWHIMKLVGLMLISAMAVVPAASQTAAQRPAFEVASVKPHKSGGPPGRLGTEGNRFIAENYPIALVIQRAYGFPYEWLTRDQLIGGPGWIQNDRFDIEAKIEGDSRVIPNEQVWLMVRSLLEDRFQLKAHHETRDLQVYNLVVAHDGLKMKLSGDQTPPKSDDEIDTFDPASPPRGETSVTHTPSGETILSGTAISISPGLEVRRPHALPPRSLTGLLRQAGRLVVDKTKVNGFFDFHLQFVPEELMGSPDVSGPTIFTAVEQQLGLKLESARGPVEVLVIDSVSKPSEN